MSGVTLSGGTDERTDQRTDKRTGGPALRQGVVLRDALPWRDCVEIVQTAEQIGYWAVFVPEITGREAFSTLAGFAAATAALHLGTGVVTVGARTAAVTAMGAATVDDLSGGRMVLGIGAGAAAGGAPGHGPLDLVRAYVRTVRAILSGARVEADVPDSGSRFRLELPGTGVVPIWVGALGDRMVRLAGEVADGVLLNWCTPERVAQARALVADGARSAGRQATDVTVAVYVRACLGVEEGTALAALREMTGRYAAFPSYRRQLEAMGLGEQAAIAAEAFREGRVEDVPESLVRELTVLGGRAEAMERFERYRAAGADVVLCYPVIALDPFSSVLGTLMAAAPSPTLER